ncbi:tetratricopeptide repeat protein, partial [Candidatus Igneacidithiobacillus taiwanensis]|uniref:tetratricopeptide repeat protein n=1 Tax=Candidatus Igneacidithiobacillus taiwanensis TaxID=1945924 RepID=UPI0028A0D2EE
MVSRRLIATPAILIVLLCGTVPANAQTNVQFLSTKAQYWQHHGRPDLATKTWEQVLLEDPRNITALAQLAILAKENGNKEKAKRYLEQIESIAPASPEIAQVKTILRQNPKFQHLVQEAAVQDQLGNYDAAVQLYRQAIGPGDPPPDLASGYFFALSKTAGGKEKAIRELESLVRNHPSPQYDLVLGQLLTYTPATRQQGVEILSRLALGRTALATQARIAWRDALTWEGASPDAIPLLRSYLANFPDPALSTQLRKAEAAATAMQKQAAHRLLAAQVQAGYTALHQGKLTVAAQIFQNLLASHPNNPQYLEALADTRLAQRNFPEALALAQQALAVAPADQRSSITALIQQARLFAILQLANKAAAGHHSSLAIHYFQKALEQNPDNLAALEGLAGEYESIKNYDQAITVYHRALGIAPSKASLWVGMLGALQGAGQDTQALQFAQSAPASLLIRLQKNPVWWANLGEVYARLRNGVAAQQALEQAVRRSKGADPNVEIQLAWVLFHNGDDDRLQDVLQRLRAVSLSPAQNAQVEDLVVLDGERRATEALKTGNETRARTI